MTGGGITLTLIGWLAEMTLIAKTMNTPVSGEDRNFSLAC